MLFERIYEDGLSQASFLIGCQQKGEAIVIDPRRDVQEYLEVAENNDMKIVAVAETHIHADYLSGTRELADATGATIYVSGEGGEDWQYEFEGERLMHDSVITLGNITITAKHTPGHTPEHLSFLITDGAAASVPGYMLTGDFVFVGDLGRPDLLDEAAGGEDTRFEGAKQLFESLKTQFLTLPDYIQVFPAHGAGSPCGKALGSVPSTTVGYERQSAWWSKYLEADDQQGFIDELLEGQPDADAYFGRMKKQNKQGPAVIGTRAAVQELSVSEAAEKLESDSAIFVDTRDQQQVHEETVQGALNIPMGEKASTFSAWAIDPETEQRDLIVLAEDEESAAEFRDALIRVGIDRVRFFTESIDGLPTFTPELIQPEELKDASYDMLLDVRGKSEYADGSIPGAEHISGGVALWHQDELPDNGTIVTFCQSGARNTVVSNALRRAGFHIVELEGSYAAWQNQAN